MPNKQHKLLSVYIVHQFAYNEEVEDDDTIEVVLHDHKILGVYLNKEQAETHRDNVFIKQLITSGVCRGLTEALLYLRGRNTYKFGAEFVWDPYQGSPYVAVTEHKVRGAMSKLLGLFGAEEFSITGERGEKLFISKKKKGLF